jgi:hypothetical protein
MGHRLEAGVVAQHPDVIGGAIRRRTHVAGSAGLTRSLAGAYGTSAGGWNGADVPKRSRRAY